jgi:pimeloyl-ACP methyl ester carboxylesterase
LTVFYEAYGNKNAPLIVFLHGGGVSGWMWDKQVKHFSEYHCIVPNIQINGNCSPFSIHRYAEEMVDLIREKANGRCITIVGFSLGAQIALEITSLAPELISYAFINSALVRPMPVTKIIIKPTIKLTSWLTKNRWFSKLQAKELYIDEVYFEQYYKDTKHMKSKSIINMLEENLSYKLSTNFRNCNVKLLVTVGEMEKQIMKKSLTKILESNAEAKGVVIPNVGHGFSFAYPHLFNQTIEAWINDRDLPNELRVLN